VKSLIEGPVANLVKLPLRETFAKIRALIEFQRGFEPLNLRLFLQVQMVFRMFIIAEIITSLHWGLHPLLQISNRDRKDETLILRLIKD